MELVQQVPSVFSSNDKLTKLAYIVTATASRLMALASLVIESGISTHPHGPDGLGSFTYM